MNMIQSIYSNKIISYDKITEIILPNEIYMKIFQYLVEEKAIYDLLNLRCVCHNFKFMTELLLVPIIKDKIGGFEDRIRGLTRRLNHMKNHLVPRLNHYKVFLSLSLGRSEISEMVSLPNPPAEVKYVITVLSMLYTGHINCTCSSCIMKCKLIDDVNIHQKKGRSNSLSSTNNNNNINYNTHTHINNSKQIYKNYQRKSNYSGYSSCSYKSNDYSGNSSMTSSSNSSNGSSRRNSIGSYSQLVYDGRRDSMTSISSDSSISSESSYNENNNNNKGKNRSFSMSSSSSSSSSSSFSSRSHKNCKSFNNDRDEESIDLPSWEEIRHIISNNDFRNWLISLRTSNNLEAVSKEHIQLVNELLNQPRITKSRSYTFNSRSNDNTNPHLSGHSNCLSTNKNNSNTQTKNDLSNQYHNISLTYERMMMVSNLGYKLLLVIEAVVQHHILTNRLNEQRDTLSRVEKQIEQWNSLEVKWSNIKV